MNIISLIGSNYMIHINQKVLRNDNYELKCAT